MALFLADQFHPAAGDARVESVLHAADTRAGVMLRPVDIVQAAIWAKDPAVLMVFALARKPGWTLQDVVAAAAPGDVARAEVGSRRRDGGFTPQALRALEEFEAAFVGHQGAREGLGLELLLHAALKNLDDDERQSLASVDVAVALHCLQDQVDRAASRRQAPGFADSPEGERLPERFLLPAEIAPSEDLTFRVRAAAMPAAFPFDDEPRHERLFDAIARVLHRRDANHVLLTGERGVGKSTVLAELTRRAAAGRIPFLRDCRFLSVDCRHVPPDESRQTLLAVLEHVARWPSLIVCIDGLASLLSGGWPSTNKPVLLAALARCRCRFIGLLTPREYAELIADDPDYADFFERVDVDEPDLDVALKLLRHFAVGLAERFRVAIDDAAVRQAVTLSANYILNDQLPAKALRVLHRVCEEIDYERSQAGSPRDRVTEEDVVRVVAEASGVPEETLRGIADHCDYEQSLREVIVGQDHAVREVATELGLIKAGMTDPDKPASVMLFLGLTGTGKTEMAKALARFYSTSKRLKTYTLGNCVEPHSVATIIGVPPGYVGNDQGGRLINELNADPYCVFLLDEADKAHPDVLQPFLNLFDEGWICDQRGVRAYANKSIFILTSNVGQRMIADFVEQGKSMEEITRRMKEALSQIRHSKSNRPVFTPEFLARIQRIIVFNPLTYDAMEGICRRLVAEIGQTWAVKRGKRLVVAEAVIRHIARQAHEANAKAKGMEGGRLVRKLIAQQVEAAVQREVTRRPDAYKRSSTLALELAASPDEAAAGAGTEAPAVLVQFHSEEELS